MIAEKQHSTAAPDQPRDLAPLAPISAEGLKPAPPGPRPALDWIPLDRLVLPRAYQRAVSEKGRRIIRRAVEEFSWSRFKALTVFALGDGRFEICDGQHSALILLTHGGFEEAPCLVTSDAGQRAAAGDFVSLNTARTNLTPMQVFASAIVAGDPVANAVQEAEDRAGVTILRSSPKGGAYKIGETVSVTALSAIVAARGAAGLERLLKIAVAAELAPIDKPMIAALQHLLWSAEYKGEIGDAAIAMAIRSGGETLRDDADLARLETGQSLKACLVVEIFRRARRGGLHG